ncbi:hypothetical protein [Agathobacter rectalis]|uniref:hypothetical protein n=1 Tax=Agathobacter rectalis TaxID=39491 RepID=UPI0027D29BC8|nr:hypothetical protein [Agathobacter rectalis]
METDTLIRKNFFKKIFGSDENISFKISSAFLISAIIFGIFTWIYKDDKNLTTAFTYASSIGFVCWMLIAKGIERLEYVGYESLRFLIFFYTLILSMNYLLNMPSLNIFWFIMACLCVFVSCIYVITKLNDLYSFMNALFVKLKMKLFNTDNISSTGIKAMIENITVLLVTIGSFFIAVKTIMKTLLQIREMF